MTLVRDLDESELLTLAAPHLPRGPRTTVPTGDDAMVLSPADGRVVVTTDVLVEGAHFRRDWSTAHQIGRRAVAQNLADVAAMGAVPLSIVVGLAMPADTEVEWVLELCRGLGEACTQAGAGVDGGDLSSGPAVMVSVTAFGDLEYCDPVLRSGARPGDVLAHVGDLGRSATGLALLEAQADLAGEDAAWAVEGHRVPGPPLEAGPQAARAGAHAMMDVSDGLLRDARRMAKASAVGIDLDLGSAHLLEAGTRVEAAGAGRLPTLDPVTAVLTGGEDHGLLAAFDADAPLPQGWHAVGRVIEGEGVLVNGQHPAEIGITGQGWDHFRA